MSETPSVGELIDILRRTLDASETAERERLILQFQKSVWNSEEPVVDDRVDDILRTAAYDLSFYEPRDNVRGEDWSLYDDDELDRRVESVLLDLDQPELDDA